MSTVILEPHPAHKMVHGMRVQLVKDQYQVMIAQEGRSPVRVAYCSVAADGPIQFIQRYPDDFREWVVAEVNKLRGGEASKIFQPPEYVEPEGDPEDDTDTEDEE